jgi:Domain of unknown function (DUF3291)
MFQLAQANYGQWKQDVTRELVQAFYDRSGEIMLSASRSGGFLWSNEGGFYKDARTIAAFKNDMIIFNMTVWETFEDLKRFVYNQVHTAVMQDRDMWFDKMPSQVSVMWWVKVDERPTIQQAREKIALINEIGPTINAFNFANYHDWKAHNIEKQIKI